MNLNEKKAILRREEDILDRIENVKRFIQMETTLMTGCGIESFSRYTFTDSKGVRIGDGDLLNNLRDEIQVQLLSIVALCYGNNPDIGEPMPMLEWVSGKEDDFRDKWEECLQWNI